MSVIRDAQRMNDVAQSALLKTLEEPPPATTLVLCVDDEEQLLPTIRSRCARIRLGTVATRDVERLLEERGLADAPTAARLARLAGGRPGIAVAYAAAPEAETHPRRARAHAAGPSRPVARGPPGRGQGSARARDDPRQGAGPGRARRHRRHPEAPRPGQGRPPTRPLRRRGRDRRCRRGSGRRGPAAEEPAAAEVGAKVSAAERRRALALLLDLWRDVARDLACAQRGAPASIRDVALLEEVEAAARRLPPGAAGEALARLVRAGELLEVNATPELVLDVLLIRWPHAEAAA